VIRKVSGLFSDLMQEPKFAAVLHRQAVMPAAQGPDAFLAFIGSYRQTAKELIDLAGTGRSSYRPE
jgi:tripartite-type tricarboxylate transporter receptor subunit TctC